MQADRTLLVMEYMYGGDLLSQIRHDSQGLFKWHRKGCSIALDIARGLTYLHSHNVRKTPRILHSPELSMEFLCCSPRDSLQARGSGICAIKFVSHYNCPSDYPVQTAGGGV